MKKLLTLLLVFALATIVAAQWNLEIEIHGEMNPDSTNIFEFKQDLIDDVAASLGVDPVFEITLGTANITVADTIQTVDVFDVRVEIDAQTASDLDDFSTIVYNYFKGKFESANLRLAYERVISW